MLGPVSRQFKDWVCGPEEAIDLAGAALHIACGEYPALDVAAYLRRLDDMAAAIRTRLSGRSPVEDTLRAINRHLFGELHFAGNTDDYYDPRNSYLNDVIERRLGIPITLSIVYLEIGWRLGLPLAGVSFPGHFLVKVNVHGGEIVLDPYAGGVSLGREDLEFRLRGVAPPGRQDDLDIMQFLEGAPKKEILHRVLRNLKAIHLKNRHDDKVLGVIEHMLCLRPDDITEIRDRGLAYSRLNCYRAAAADLSRYLAEIPDAADIDEVRERLIEAQGVASRLH